MRLTNLRYSNINAKLKGMSVKKEKTIENDIYKIKRILSQKEKEIFNVFISKYEKKSKNISYKEYFSDLYKKAENYDKDLKKLVGEKIDLLNIIWIYRMKKNYNMTEEEIKSKLIEVNYKINNQIIYELIKSKDFEEMKEILKNTYYRKIIENVREDQIEKDINEILYKKYQREFAKSKYNLSTVFYYMLIQEYKIKIGDEKTWPLKK